MDVKRSVCKEVYVEAACDIWVDMLFTYYKSWS